MGYDYEISYKKGRENVVADALSRVQSNELMIMAISAISSELMPEIQLSWEKDAELRNLISQLQQTDNVKSPYAWLQGQLRRNGRIVVGKNPQLQLQIIKMFHEGGLGGHSGMTATLKRLSTVFFWKGMQKQVRQFIRQCDICQRYKNEVNASPGLLQPLPIPQTAWSQISMDFIEGLPVSGGKNVIFVVVDRLTKYAHFMGLRHPYTAVEVAQTFFDNVFKLHGLPHIIVSDRDPIFTSKFWQEIFKMQGVSLHLSYAYHPQTDGQTEVVNRGLETYLRCSAGDQPKTWFRWLSLAEWWYNSNHHSAIQLTPFEALYGYPPPIHLPYLPESSNVQQVEVQLQDRESMLQLLKHHLQRAQSRMKMQADKRRVDRQFEMGAWVYLKLQPYRQNTLADRQFQKLAPKYFGPYQVEDRIGSVAYKLRLPSGSQLHPVFHVSQLKKKIGVTGTIGTQLPILGDVHDWKPLAVLDRRTVKRGNQAATQVLVHWTNSFPEDATWEFLYDLQKKFPDFQP